MSTGNVVFLVALWLLVNAIYPLLLNSIDRQYRKQIDWFVRVMMRLSGRAVVRIVQVLLILIGLPSWILIAILDLAFPQLFKFRSLAEMRVGRDAVFAKDFPKAIIADLNRRREK